LQGFDVSHAYQPLCPRFPRHALTLGEGWPTPEEALSRACIGVASYVSSLKVAATNDAVSEETGLFLSHILPYWVLELFVSLASCCLLAGLCAHHREKQKKMSGIQE